MRRSALVLAASLVLALAGPHRACAHAFAPSLLSLRQVGQAEGVTTFQVRWKQPAVQPSGARLRPHLPAECAGRDDGKVEREGTGVVATWTVDCAGGLDGRTLSVDGIGGSRADVLLRLEWSDGRTLRQILTADQPSYPVTGRQGPLAVAAGYTRLGIEHILLGFDHLLFVFGLLLLVVGRRQLLTTVTAFTAGHSVTLALASLGVVHFDQRPIEAAIAASIFVLAVELSRRLGDQERPPTLIQRRPWLVAGGFGLLHGLGFAGALAQVGLPQGEIPVALLAFNVGIELGQLAFLLAAIGAMRLLAKLPALDAPQFASVRALAPIYLIGVLSAYWFCQRLALAVGW